MCNKTKDPLGQFAECLAALLTSCIVISIIFFMLAYKFSKILLWLAIPFSIPPLAFVTWWVWYKNVKQPIYRFKEVNYER